MIVHSHMSGIDPHTRLWRLVTAHAFNLSTSIDIDLAIYEYQVVTLYNTRIMDTNFYLWSVSWKALAAACASALSMILAMVWLLK